MSRPSNTAHGVCCHDSIPDRALFLVNTMARWLSSLESHNLPAQLLEAMSQLLDSVDRFIRTFQPTRYSSAKTFQFAHCSSILEEGSKFLHKWVYTVLCILSLHFKSSGRLVTRSVNTPSSSTYSAALLGVCVKYKSSFNVRTCTGP